MVASEALFTEMVRTAESLLHRQSAETLDGQVRLASTSSPYLRDFANAFIRPQDDQEAAVALRRRARGRERIARGTAGSRSGLVGGQVRRRLE